jgi:hypothetical protein
VDGVGEDDLASGSSSASGCLLVSDADLRWGLLDAGGELVRLLLVIGRAK